ncbi:sigma-70 family RNA polymerase sigma factor [Streptomyces sp. NPDC059166]|uniref:sigma-70 family RNA polymerase sigma factor n=1 Tax=Streptomyces sp. NPDC059166 TaxID=3346752 RepID=UPI003695FE76
MGEARETALIKAAQHGDTEAQDRLVASYLPLVYNIVGRALNGHADVDDVVQDSVLRMLRGLPSLRSPKSFRSWFVAITMNEIRGHRRRRTGELPTAPVDDRFDVVDPAADFVELTIVRLGLTGQRREAAEATRWLDPEDRELVSLWWLEAAGQLSRAEVAQALGLSPQHAAVRVQRMKERLESARVVVRALAAVPRCVLLEDLTAGWSGVPSALWRKRLARHARECTVCAGHRSGLVPPEGLLAGLAVVPVAARTATGGPEDTPVKFLSTTTVPGPGRAARRRDSARRRRRTTVVAGLAAVAVLGGGGAAVHLYTDDTVEDPATALTPLTGPSSPVTALPSASVAPPSPTPSVSRAAPTRSGPASPSASASRSASPAPRHTPKPRPKPSPPSSAPADAAARSVAEEVIALVNTERSKSGCEPVSGNTLLDKAATRHSEDMAARDYFSHTSPEGTDPGARITAEGYRWSTYGENIAKGQQSAASVMDAWMNSEGHRANILNCAFKEIGVGRVDSSGGPVWTQNFAAAL